MSVALASGLGILIGVTIISAVQKLWCSTLHTVDCPMSRMHVARFA